MHSLGLVDYYIDEFLKSTWHQFLHKLVYDDQLAHDPVLSVLANLHWCGAEGHTSPGFVRIYIWKLDHLQWSRIHRDVLPALSLAQILPYWLPHDWQSRGSLSPLLCQIQTLPRLPWYLVCLLARDPIPALQRTQQVHKDWVTLAIRRVGGRSEPDSQVRWRGRPPDLLLQGQEDVLHWVLCWLDVSLQHCTPVSIQSK